MLDLQLPSHFRLRDLTAITAPVFELKHNPFLQEASVASETWFRSFNVYEGKNLARFLSHGFDKFADVSFPDADADHLAACIAFFFWAFSFDDLSDEGELQSKPEIHKLGVDISLQVLRGEIHEPLTNPYAAMLQDLWERLNATATHGACARARLRGLISAAELGLPGEPAYYFRFAQAAENWANSQVQQSTNRATSRMPSVAEFISMRRHTIGGAMVEAMVEYSLDIDLPDFVFEDPVMRAMSDATNDIMTWPNDLVSFNKEQADGDDQNLVFCIMVERNTDLQGAIDILTTMIADRVDKYVDLKSQLPSFGPRVDAELNRYLRGLEQFVQGTVVWYYSPRYFRDLDISDRSELIVPIFERK